MTEIFKIKDKNNDKMNEKLIEILEKSNALFEQGFNNHELYEKSFKELEFLGRGITCEVFQVIDKNDTSKNYAIKKMKVSTGGNLALEILQIFKELGMLSLIFKADFKYCLVNYILLILFSN